MFLACFEAFKTFSIFRFVLIITFLSKFVVIQLHIIIVCVIEVKNVNFQYFG